VKGKPVATCSAGEVKVARLLRATDKDLADLNDLIAASGLSRNPVPKSMEHLKQLLSSCSRLYVARCNDRIVAMSIMTIIYYLAGPTGVKGFVDDVATHPDFTRRGISQMIHAQMLAEAPSEMTRVELSVASDEEHAP